MLPRIFQTVMTKVTAFLSKELTLPMTTKRNLKTMNHDLHTGRPERRPVGTIVFPGGTDFAAARRLGHTALHALSLPTVWAPETAGEALARTVQAILQEREGTI